MQNAIFAVYVYVPRRDKIKKPVRGSWSPVKLHVRQPGMLLGKTGIWIQAHIIGSVSMERENKNAIPLISVVLTVKYDNNPNKRNYILRISVVMRQTA